MARGIRKGYEHVRGLSMKIKNRFGERLKTMEGCLDAMEYIYAIKKNDEDFLKNTDYHALDAGYSLLRKRINGNGDCLECDERYGRFIEISDRITKSMRLKANKKMLKRLKKEGDDGGEKDVRVVSLPEDYKDEINYYGTWPLVPIG